jgi:hypothetical protein
MLAFGVADDRFDGRTSAQLALDVFGDARLWPAISGLFSSVSFDGPSGIPIGKNV